MENKEKLVAEAIRRIEMLTKKYSLNPNLLKYFKEGKIYYTESIIPGIWASMDNITYDEKYVKIVNRLERVYDVMVYHCILTGPYFSMLYVSPHENEWEMQRPAKNSDWIMAAVYNMEEDEFDFGDIKLSAATNTLIRVG